MSGSSPCSLGAPHPLHSHSHSHSHNNRQSISGSGSSYGSGLQDGHDQPHATPVDSGTGPLMELASSYAAEPQPQPQPQPHEITLHVTLDTSEQLELSSVPCSPFLSPSVSASASSHDVSLIDGVEANAARDAMRFGKQQAHAQALAQPQAQPPAQPTAHSQQHHFLFDQASIQHHTATISGHDPHAAVLPVDARGPDTAAPVPTPAPAPAPASVPRAIAVSIPPPHSDSARSPHSPYHSAYVHQSSIHDEFGKHAHVYDRLEMHRIAKHESLDYHTTHNHIWVIDQFHRFYYHYQIHTAARWVMAFIIAVVIGFTAFVLRDLVEIITDAKFGLISSMLSSYYIPSPIPSNLVPPFLTLVAINIGACCVGSILVIFYAPAAAGSGIPEVKSYLNGTNVPHVFTLAALITKVIGIVSSISSSLVVGADPMVHSGAMIGGWLSQARLCRSCHDACRRRQHRAVLRRMQHERQLAQVEAEAALDIQPQPTIPEQQPLQLEQHTSSSRSTSEPNSPRVYATRVSRVHVQVAASSSKLVSDPNPNPDLDPGLNLNTDTASSPPGSTHGVAAPSSESHLHTWDVHPSRWDFGGHITAFLHEIQHFRNDRY